MNNQRLTFSTIHFLLLCLIFTLLLSSCIKEQENPNAAHPEDATLNELYTSIQLQFNDVHQGTYLITAPLIRQLAMTQGNSYETAMPHFDSNELWTSAYSGLFQDIRLLRSLDKFKNATFERATSRILEAFALTILVDIYGDIPWDEALMGLRSQHPDLTDDRKIYLIAHDYLDLAIKDLKSISPSVEKAPDLYYDGNIDHWISLANTLHFKMYLNEWASNPVVAEKMEELILLNQFIDTYEENFFFQYSDVENPESRHPVYKNIYVDGENIFLGSFYIDLMVNGLNTYDTRTRSFLYRRIKNTYHLDPELFNCSLSEKGIGTIPDHYLDIDSPYCIAMTKGYFGRDHGNHNPIGGNDQFSTTISFYPFGGKYDIGEYKPLNDPNLGGLNGQGLNPIMMAEYYYMMRAEYEEMMNKEGILHLLNAVKSNFENLLIFEKQLTQEELNIALYIDPIGPSVYVHDYVTSPFYIEKYIQALEYKYLTSQNSHLQLIITEYMKMLIGNGLEAYNAYRRTGKPENIQPLLHPEKSTFPRTLPYPSVYLKNNINAQQKPLSEKVFWDIHPDDFLR